MSGDMHGELATVWSIAATDPEVRCIVFTGGGDRAFSAGGNLETAAISSSTIMPPIPRLSVFIPRTYPSAIIRGSTSSGIDGGKVRQ